MNKKLLYLLFVSFISFGISSAKAEFGDADFPDVPTVFPIKKGKSKTIEIQNEKLTQSISNEFQLYCGWITQRDFKKCKIQFKDGRLTVDDSLGIKSS